MFPGHMQVIHHVDALRDAIQSERFSGRTLGFVPTMGALHAGHAALMRRASSENDLGIASIFVNPTQFGPNEDLDKYPRTLAADLEICRREGIAIVFAPQEAEIYPEGKRDHEIQMGLRNLDKVLCGASRPGHFNGVLQVVSKLFNIVQPTRAYFGEKDFQQLTILRTLAAELFFSVEVVPCEIVRETDGLAMSSRNRYLNEEERIQALFLKRAIDWVQQSAQDGLSVHSLRDGILHLAASYPLIRLDYFDVRASERLQEVDRLERQAQPRVFIAAFCGTTRLIDNGPVFPVDAG